MTTMDEEMKPSTLNDQPNASMSRNVQSDENVLLEALEGQEDALTSSVRFRSAATGKTGDCRSWLS